MRGGLVMECGSRRRQKTGRRPVVSARLRSDSMCAACVAQGVLFAGTAAGGLRLMAAHATMRRASGRLPAVASDDTANHGDKSSLPDTSQAAP